MTTTDTAPAEAALPAWLTPSRVARLATLVAADARAQRVATTSPYTGAPLADLPVSTPDDVEDAFARARAAQARWAATPWPTASASCCASTTWSSSGRTKPST